MMVMMALMMAVVRMVVAMTMLIMIFDRGACVEATGSDRSNHPGRSILAHRVAGAQSQSVGHCASNSRATTLSGRGDASCASNAVAQHYPLS